MKIKKLLATVLSAAMVVGSMAFSPVSASAETEQHSFYLLYNGSSLTNTDGYFTRASGTNDTAALNSSNVTGTTFQFSIGEKKICYFK